MAGLRSVHVANAATPVNVPDERHNGHYPCPPWAKDVIVSPLHFQDGHSEFQGEWGSFDSHQYLRLPGLVITPVAMSGDDPGAEWRQLAAEYVHMLRSLQTRATDLLAIAFGDIQLPDPDIVENFSSKRIVIAQCSREPELHNVEPLAKRAVLRAEAFYVELRERIESGRERLQQIQRSVEPG